MADMSYQNADATRSSVPVSEAKPLPVKTIAASGGGITWQAPQAVAMTGSSMTFVPANAARKALQMWSASSNGSGAIDLAGGTAVIGTSIPLFAGAAPIYIDGPATPVSIVTAIGTSGQSFYYQEGL